MSQLETIYIDVNDEITTVIERLKASHAPIVALVVPKGAPLLQSIVNLKLARKAALDAEKDLVLVTTDKIGRNLANQVGIPVASSEKEAGKVASGSMSGSADDDAPVIAGVRIHRYYSEDAETPEEDPEPPVVIPLDTSESPVLVPKTLMQPEPSLPELAAAPVIETITTTPSAPTTPASIKRSSIDQDAPSMPVAQTSTAKTIPAPVPASTKQRRFRLAAYIVVFLILALTTVSFLYLPKTVITLHAQATPWTKELTYTAHLDSTQPSSDNTVLVATLLKNQTDSTLPVTATGTQVTGETAKGTATFYNYTSTSAQPVAAGAKVTAAGKVFITQEATSVPGYTQAGLGKPLIPGSASVAVIADSAGEDGNVTDAAMTGTVAGNSNLSGKVTSSGGTTKQVTVLSATDIANAKVALTKQLQDLLAQKMTDSIKDMDYRFQTGSDVFTLTTFNVDQAAGAQVSSATATGSATLERVAVDAAAIKAAAAARLNAETPAGQTRTIGGTEITTTTQNTDRSLTIISRSTGGLSPVVVTTGLADAVKGKTIDAATAILKEQSQASSVTIQQLPSWWPLKKLPSFSRFISIQTVYE